MQPQATEKQDPKERRVEGELRSNTENSEQPDGKGACELSRPDGAAVLDRGMMRHLSLRPTVDTTRSCFGPRSPREQLCTRTQTCAPSPM